MSGIDPIGQMPALIQQQTAQNGVREPDGETFAQTLTQAVARTEGLQDKAKQAVQAFNTGESQSLHDTMVAMEKADISLRFMTQVRNKAVDAYKQIMRMQV
jgi:flagellar hook-basal body complex protein FliE